MYYCSHKYAKFVKFRDFLLLLTIEENFSLLFDTTVVFLFFVFILLEITPSLYIQLKTSVLLSQCTRSTDFLNGCLLTHSKRVTFGYAASGRVSECRTSRLS